MLERTSPVVVNDDRRQACLPPGFEVAFWRPKRQIQFSQTCHHEPAHIFLILKLSLFYGLLLYSLPQCWPFSIALYQIYFSYLHYLPPNEDTATFP